ncbi:AfsR/SARP family transcriptional regulator [Streptomyces kanamyceticus]|uniref:SARP family transcriptional regulator n=1 Tax=Streptomyces kanamyceticus TaxID=1967 RepID=A0A5J6GUB8_STRKN|nr:BTAD domain-containing putative transcriptional regulator [Streptomyces kanamyceticus]QEU96646.1 SARP family transcriptional regulator [Streptomyces kanamyceticus]
MVSSLVESLARAESGCDNMVHLFGGPFVTLAGEHIEVPEGSKRLLVFVALQSGQVERRYVAASLWPLGDEARACGNLRSALWRLRQMRLNLIDADKTFLRLDPGVSVDVGLVCNWAQRLIRDELRPCDLAPLPWRLDDLDFLPGCYDDWALMERERVRQRLLHALEALSRALLVRGRCAEAVDVALTVVSAEPLRETAQRLLIEAHIAERNWHEARRALDRYRRTLRAELGIEPGHELLRLTEGPSAPLYGRIRDSADGVGHKLLRMTR